MDVWVILSSGSWPEYPSVCVAASQTSEWESSSDSESLLELLLTQKVFMHVLSSPSGLLWISEVNVTLTFNNIDVCVDMSDPARTKKKTDSANLVAALLCFSPDEQADTIKSCSAACCTSPCSSSR